MNYAYATRRERDASEGVFILAAARRLHRTTVRPNCLAGTPAIEQTRTRRASFAQSTTPRRSSAREKAIVRSTVVEQHERR